MTILKPGMSPDEKINALACALVEACKQRVESEITHDPVRPDVLTKAKAIAREAVDRVDGVGP